MWLLRKQSWLHGWLLEKLLVDWMTSKVAVCVTLRKAVVAAIVAAWVALRKAFG